MFLSPPGEGNRPENRSVNKEAEDEKSLVGGYSRCNFLCLCPVLWVRNGPGTVYPY